jgi:hypothetical protein
LLSAAATDTLALADAPGSGPSPIVLVGIFLLAFGVVAIRLSRRLTR